MLRDIYRQPDAARTEVHRWADWIELHCLAHEDRLLAFGDVLDLVAGTAEPDADIEPIEDDLGLTSGDPAGEFPEEAQSRGRPSAADLRTRHRPDAQSSFRLLEHRQAMFGASYPFQIEEPPYASAGQLLRASDELTESQQHYVFYLLCSLLRYVEKDNEHGLTSEFERRSAEALKRVAGPAAEVHLFGTAPAAGARYSGNLQAKLAQLVDDLNESFHPAFKQPGENDTGDGGLDIVAWIPLGDSSAGMVVIFGQAACTPQWVSKQHSASKAAWSQRLTMMAPQTVVCCIPFCFRDAQGGWHDTADIQESVLLDRSRLLHLLADVGPPDAEVLEKAKDVFNELVAVSGPEAA